jgi:hypothetical protein
MKLYRVYLKNILEEVVLDLDETVLKRLVDCYNTGTDDVMIKGKSYTLSNYQEIIIFRINNVEGFRREESNLWNRFLHLLFLKEEYLTSIEFTSKFGSEITDELIFKPFSENRTNRSVNTIKNIVNDIKKTPKTYIDITRLEQLKSISNSRFDLSKLIQYCEEINKSFHNNCLLSVAMLVRAIIDHVPPIFDKSTFNEVANNYGSRSFQGSMKNLNNSLRKIADSYLHTHIRSKEDIPNETQINFSQDLDVLLAEICRILK